MPPSYYDLAYERRLAALRAKKKHHPDDLLHPTEFDWGSRRGRPWTDDDVICAKFLRHCGLTSADIGEVLNRTAESVDGKIGYQTREEAENFAAARPKLAGALGDLADQVYLATAISAGRA